jgi:dTDP-4-amino-4,6-dideoxygalactose transaminase
MTNAKPIPFNRASLSGRELEYAFQAMADGQIAGNHAFSIKCETMLQAALGVPRALLTTSCTHALEMAALLLDLRQSDEVIVPSFTFVSTANAFALRGARIVFADIRPDTLNLDETRLEPLITPRTKAIVPVHYGGVGCEMDAILEIAGRHGLTVVEDNAHGLFGKYKGRWLGSIGGMATQSFHATKNITCGEGGALLINDRRLVDRAEVIREKGTNRSRFFRGQVDKYSWVDLGSSYVISDLLAAFLCAQLEISDQIQAKRQRVWEYYACRLQSWAEEHHVRLPVVPAHCEQSYHLFYLLFPDLETRQRFIAHLQFRNVASVFHYVPLHTSEMGRKFGGRAGDCPVSEEISDRLIRLPFYNSLCQADQDRVIDAILKFDGASRRATCSIIPLRDFAHTSSRSSSIGLPKAAGAVNVMAAGPGAERAVAGEKKGGLWGRR